MAARKITRQDMRDSAEKYKNWGKWGPNDEIGTLNYTSAEDIVAATRLVKKGKVISLALNFDHTGPQGAKSKYPSMGRTNPIHTMLRTGTDAYSGVLDKRGIRAADDMVTMPLQCGTQWDGLGHVFGDDRDVQAGTVGQVEQLDLQHLAGVLGHDPSQVEVGDTGRVGLVQEGRARREEGKCGRSAKWIGFAQHHGRGGRGTASDS